MDKQKLLKQWTDRAAKLLVGRTIVAVSYLGEKSCREMMWDRSCLVLTLDNGLHVFSSADDEGNGPGALYTDAAGLPCIPVI